MTTVAHSTPSPRVAKLFTTFLTEREPFKREFNKKIASDFYRNVRCALLHEARHEGDDCPRHGLQAEDSAVRRGHDGA